MKWKPPKCLQSLKCQQCEKEFPVEKPGDLIRAYCSKKCRNHAAWLRRKENLKLQGLKIFQGLKQQDLAEKLGCSQSAISEWQSGKRPIPQDKLIIIQLMQEKQALELKIQELQKESDV